MSKYDFIPQYADNEQLDENIIDSLKNMKNLPVSEGQILIDQIFSK